MKNVPSNFSRLRVSTISAWLIHVTMRTSVMIVLSHTSRRIGQLFQNKLLRFDFKWTVRTMTRTNTGFLTRMRNIATGMRNGENQMGSEGKICKITCKKLWLLTGTFAFLWLQQTGQGPRRKVDLCPQFKLNTISRRSYCRVIKCLIADSNAFSRSSVTQLWSRLT